MKKKLFNRNFTMVVIGQIISLFGNSILRFALSLYVLDVTGSATIFGGILGFSMIPVILLSPFGGMIADRLNRRNIMYSLDFLTAALIVVSSFFLQGNSQVVAVAVLLVLLSVIQAFYQPSVQSSVPLLQDSGNLVQANAVVNQVNALANLLGPVIGGALYGMFGLQPILIISAASFLASAILELFLVIPYTPPTEKIPIFATVKQDFKVSMRFMAIDQPDILKSLIVVSLINLLGSSVIVVGMPYLIRVVLELSAEHYGIAQGFMGAAGIVGGIVAGVIAPKFKLRNLYLLLMGFAILTAPLGAAFLLPMSGNLSYWITVITMALMQLGGAVFSIFAMSAVQMKTPNELLGKVMSYMSTLCMCAMPIGQAIYGFLFDRFSDNVSYIMFAAGCLLLILSIFSKPVFFRFEQKSQTPKLPPEPQEA